MYRLLTMFFVLLIAACVRIGLSKAADPSGSESLARSKGIDVDKLKKHDHKNKETVLAKIRFRQQESVVWYSKRPFKIFKITNVDDENENPFYRAIEMCAIRDGEASLWIVASGPPKEDEYGVEGKLYKPWIEFTQVDSPCTGTGEKIDPHISVHVGK